MAISIILDFMRKSKWFSQVCHESALEVSSCFFVSSITLFLLSSDRASFLVSY